MLSRLLNSWHGIAPDVYDRSVDREGWPARLLPTALPQPAHVPSGIPRVCVLLRPAAILGLCLVVSCGCGVPEQSAAPTSSSTPSSSTPSSSTPRPVVQVTSWPLLEFTRAVAGPELTVEPAGPAKTLSRRWRPAASSARRMQQANLLLLSGAGYEPWKDRVSLPMSRLIDTSQGYLDQLIRIPDAVVHQHGPAGAHSHPGVVWSTWLDPELAMSQVKQVSIACAKLLPQQSAEFTARAARLQAELQTVDDLLVKRAEKKTPENLRIFADTPYYLYLTRRLGWELTYLHWPEASEPLSQGHRDELEQLVADGSGGIFLMLAGRDDATAGWLESMGLRVIRIDVCEEMSDNGGSITERMKSNILRLGQLPETNVTP